MKRLAYRAFSMLLLLALAGCEPGGSGDDAALQRQRAHAAAVTIIRDDYGVPHVYGKRDADAVFGLMYAQAEDDFPRIERNYYWAIGRLAEVEGEQALFSDLRARLYMTEAEARNFYSAAPPWLQELCQAWADGLNYYLHTHPEVRPQLLARFEPWMTMYFFEGSIGGDIEQIPLPRMFPLPAGLGVPLSTSSFRGKRAARPHETSSTREKSGCQALKRSTREHLNHRILHASAW